VMMTQKIDRKPWFTLIVAAAALFLFAGVLQAYDDDDARKTAFLGVHLEEETDDPEGGALIVRVVEGTAAADAGLEDGDVIQQVDGRTIRGPAGLSKVLGELEPGDRVSIVIQRDGRRQTVDAELGSHADLEGWAGMPHIEHMGEWTEELAEQMEQLGEQMREQFGGHAFAFRSPRPRLGVQLIDATPELREHLGADRELGVLVGKVLESTPAEDAGVLVGDLIVAIDGEEVASPSDLIHALHELDGQTFELGVVRDGREIGVRVELPESDDAHGVPGPRALFFNLRPAAPGAPRLHAVPAPSAMPPMPPMPAPVAPVIDLRDMV